jgi:hypothetical protein
MSLAQPKKSCAFCGGRDAVAWASFRGEPRRICQVCKDRRDGKPKPKPPRVVDLVRAVVPTMPVITVDAVRAKLPRGINRTAVVMAVHAVRKAGNIVVVSGGGRGGRKAVYRPATPHERKAAA